MAAASLLVSCTFFMLMATFSLAETSTTMSAFVVSSTGCPKCDTAKKSGKRSCCARGGAWFKNCGDAGDTKYNHTWTEGIRACQGFATLVSVQLPQQVIGNAPQSTQSRNNNQQQTHVYRPCGMSGAGDTDSEHCAGLAKVAVGIYVSFTVLSLRM